MEYKILSSGLPKDLTSQVKQHINEGWKPIGSHQAAVIRSYNRYSGQKHMDTISDVVYSQTMIKED